MPGQCRVQTQCRPHSSFYLFIYLIIFFRIILSLSSPLDSSSLLCRAAHLGGTGVGWGGPDDTHRLYSIPIPGIFLAANVISEHRAN